MPSTVCVCAHVCMHVWMQVRAYFPLDHVVSTTMEIYQELLGLVFEVHNYISHDYIGRNYVGHDYVGHNDMGHYYLDHNHTGDEYMGHSYIGHNHIGRNYAEIYQELPVYIKIPSSVRYAYTITHHQ